MSTSKIKTAPAQKAWSAVQVASLRKKTQTLNEGEKKP